MTDGVASESPSIEFVEVGHAYDTRTVLEGVTVTLTERRIGIVGANGSGKSTFARMINGLVRPDRGTVRVGGVDVARHRRRIRRQVGFIFSDPDRQVIMPTVAEDVELSLSRSEIPRADRPDAVQRVLEQFRLADHADHPSHQLSGGQKQLLALASVLVTRPQVLVADEPTTLLDLRNSRMLARVFAELDEQLIVATHDLDLLVDFDRVLVLDEGHLVADDVPAAAIAHYRKSMA